VKAKELTVRKNKKIDAKYFFLGCLIPLTISFSVYLFVRLFSFDEHLLIFWFGVFSEFPLYKNIISCSFHIFEFFFIFFFGVILIPLMIPYWYRVTPSEFKNKLHRSNKKFILKLIFSIIFLVIIIIGSWFVSIDSLSDRRSGIFKYSFENPIFYYIFFIFPMSLISWFIAGGAKFIYLEFKNTH
jgi:hypothetical protein